MSQILEYFFDFFSGPFSQKRNTQGKDSASVTHNKSIAMNALTMNDTHDIPNGSIFSCHWVFTTEAFQTIYLIYAVGDALANELMAIALAQTKPKGLK